MGRRDFSLLIVDDSPGLRQEVRKLLSGVDFIADCREAENGVDAYKKVRHKTPDLILCDLVMPAVDGFKFLTLLRGQDQYRAVPVILLTGKTDVETKIRGLDLGASDYVTKPFDGGELLARIKVQLKIKALQDELHRSNELLRELASTDPLTRLYNRRHFMRALETEFERVGRHGTPLSFVMLDIDHFKRVNDEHGHQVGDAVLRAFGALLLEQARTTDVAARYGGEEFAVLLPQTELEGGREFAHRFRSALEERPFSVGGRQLRVTVSAGLAFCPHPRVNSGEDLIRLADQAIYRAKTAGRNCVLVEET